MRLSCIDFKIWKLVKSNCKFYVFACIFMVVVVNIWISLFIRLYNLYFLRNILRKISETPTYWKETKNVIKNLLACNFFFFLMNSVQLFINLFIPSHFNLFLDFYKALVITCSLVTTGKKKNVKCKWYERVLSKDFTRFVQSWLCHLTDLYKLIVTWCNARISKSNVILVFTFMYY